MQNDRPDGPALELVERYVREVERWLPRRQRAAVGRELRGSLTDALAKRTADGMAPEAAAGAILRELGRPAAVAQRYAGRRPLVSPGLTPAFLRLAGSVVGLLALLGVANLAWAARGASEPARSFAAGLPSLVATLVSTSLQLLGLLLLIFVAIEWIGRPGRSRRRFDPLELPPLRSAEPVHRAGLAIHAAVAALLLAWFHLFPERVAILVSLDGGDWRALPILGNGFHRALPWLTGWWLAVLAAHGALLVRGRWSLGLRLADLTAQLAGLVALAALFLADPLIAASPAELAAAGVPRPSIARLVGELLPLLDALAKVAVGIAWAALGIGTARRILDLLRSQG